jgi:peptidoglycan glycosyltransferase
MALALPVLAALSYSANVGAPASDILVPLSAVGAVAVACYVWMRIRIPSADQTLYCIILALIGIGLVMIARLDADLDSRRFTKQVAWICIALVAMAVTAVGVRRPEKLAAYQYLCGVVAVLLVLAPTLLHAILGGGGDIRADEINGARLWIQFGNYLSLQPSEFAKILVAIFLAGYLTEKGDVLAHWPYRIFGRIAVPPLRHAGPILLVWLASLGLLAAQRDLGSALLIFCLFLEMLYSATGRVGYPLVGLILFTVGAGALIHAGGEGMFSHVETRIQAWLDPWPHADTGGYQMIQSLFALAQGDVLGTGLGQGMPTRIPEVSTDFIFSAIAEELGLVGGCAVILLFSFLAVRGFVAAGRAKDDFCALLAAGLTAGLVTQAAIIICGVTKFLPMTGITLPFVSYGGSSVVASAIAVGLLIRISADPTPTPRAAGDRPRTRPLAWLHLALFLLLSVWLGYWHIVRGPELNAHERNPRLYVAEERIVRGDIVDRRGNVLAEENPETGERTYPAARAAAHIVGYTSRQHGSAGIEASAAGWLLGLRSATSGIKELVQEARQGARGLPPTGNDVALTIDLALQQRGHELMSGDTGAIAAVNPRTGAILCLVSRPTYDPAHIAEVLAESAGDPSDTRLLNRATQGLYPPGSTFKILVAAAALDAGLIRPQDRFTCTGEEIIRGNRIRCWNRAGHGEIDLREAITGSCNVYFANVGERFLASPQAGTSLFAEYCGAFGFGAAPPVGLSVEPSRITKDDDLTAAKLLESCFGQGELMVTPLHMAMIAGGIANRGEVMAPQIIERVTDPSGDTIYAMEPRRWRYAVGAPAAEFVGGVMRQVVTEGTGRAAGLSAVEVAGKTGTAETGRGADHAWFVAYAPASDPEIAVAVIIEESGAGGGTAAAPKARELLRTYFALPD